MVTQIDTGILCRFLYRYGVILVAFIAIALSGNNAWRVQLYLVPQLPNWHPQ